MQNYARDLIGYGATPQKVHWPNGARIAVQFVLNYEEGAESNILHGDASSETFLSEIIGAQELISMSLRKLGMSSIFELSGNDLNFSLKA